MNRLPLATSLLSLAAAVGLWLIATWLEDDVAQRGAPREPQTAIATDGVRRDSPLRTVAEGPVCVDVENALRETVEASQYCSTDDDCTLFDFGYPIECLTSVARSEITPLRLAYREYEATCPYRVYYDCPTGSTRREPVCRNQRCTVELRSTGILEDETLDYLGIDPPR